MLDDHYSQFLSPFVYIDVMITYFHCCFLILNREYIIQKGNLPDFIVGCSYMNFKKSFSSIWPTFFKLP